MTKKTQGQCTSSSILRRNIFGIRPTNNNSERISHGSHGNCANKMAAASCFKIGSCTDLVSRLETERRQISKKDKYQDKSCFYALRKFLGRDHIKFKREPLSTSSFVVHQII
ncbi:hypothetical protein M0804_004575 [Polistes exclamans]|nr:hypothetical protein M0804_004575 [Polistes exclamans]